MPTSTVIRLFPTEDVFLPPTMGHYAHAAFLDILSRVDPEAAGKIHAMPGQKPFTVSPLQGKFERQGDKVLIRQGSECWLRVTFLDDKLFSPFSRYFLEVSEGPTLRLGAGHFQLTRLSTSGVGEDAKWSGHKTFEQLMDEAQTHTRIDVRFYSPTAFKVRDPKGGKSRNLASPDPLRCYQSWVSKWNAFSKIPIEKDRLLLFVHNHAMLWHISTRTKMMDFGRYKELGFVGRCGMRFEENPHEDPLPDEAPAPGWDESLDGETEQVFPPPVPGPLEEEMLRQVNLLADFAFYCGTGYKTSMGMGQTRRQG